MNKEDPITGIRYKLMRALHYFTSCVVLWTASGNIWVTYERPNICYKKYLGPDWKPDYDWKRCGSVVSNHSSFLDIPLHAIAQLPSIIAKNEVKYIPGIGPIATAS
jgi:1-acyl-sn-glycerol-3-phosphate acyltransferase